MTFLRRGVVFALIWDIIRVTYVIAPEETHNSSETSNDFLFVFVCIGMEISLWNQNIFLVFMGPKDMGLMFLKNF